MGQSCRPDFSLTQGQIKLFKLSVSAACRKMTADQILEIADQLHDIIRRRGGSCGTVDVAAYDHSACADTALALELPQ